MASGFVGSVFHGLQAGKAHVSSLHSKPRVELDGLIFVHNISTDKIKNRQFLPDPSVLSKLCGKDWAQKCVLATTHWDQLWPESLPLREREILNYWSYMTRNGSTTKRYDRNRTSAWEILQPLVGVAEAAREARLYQELANLRDFLPPWTLDDVGSVLNQKANLIRDVITGLGGNVELTSEEQRKYSRLNEEAQALWKKLQEKIDSTELEERLAPKLKSQGKKYIAYVVLANLFHIITNEHSPES